MRRGLFLVCLLTLRLALSAQSASGVPTQAQTTSDTYSKSSAATKQMKAPFGDFVIWYDPEKWQVEKTDSIGELEFKSTNGEAFAKIITEKTAIPTDSLAQVALTNAKGADPNTKITAQEKRRVNGHDVLMLQMDGTIDDLPIRFYGYYYGGTSGTVQVVTFSMQSAFAKNTPDLTNFLDGLVISDEPLTAAASDASSKGPVVLQLNDGKASVQYDPKKWRQEPTGEDGHLTIAHRHGDAYAIIVAERIAISLDAMPDIALKNAQSAAPDARIVSKEKRSVNGVDVWFVKLDATVSGALFRYYDYLYGGKAGTIQLITFTGQNLIAEYEPDLLEFLNSFRVQEQ